MVFWEGEIGHAERQGPYKTATVDQRVVFGVWCLVFGVWLRMVRAACTKSEDLTLKPGPSSQRPKHSRA